MPTASMSSSSGPPPKRSVTRSAGRSPWIPPQRLTDSISSRTVDSPAGSPGSSMPHQPGFRPLSIRPENSEDVSMASSVYAQGVYDGKDPRPHRGPGVRGKREKRRKNEPPQEEEQHPQTNSVDLPHPLGYIPSTSKGAGSESSVESHYKQGVYDPANQEATRDPNTHDDCPFKGPKKKKDKLTHPLGRIPKACGGGGGRKAESHYTQGIYDTEDLDATRGPNIHDDCADESQEDGEIELSHPLGRIPKACGGGGGRKAESHYTQGIYDTEDLDATRGPNTHDDCADESQQNGEIELSHPLGRIPKACGGGGGRTARSHYIPEEYNPYTPEGIHVESTHDYCTYKPKKVPMDLSHPLGRIPPSCNSTSGLSVAVSHYVPEDYNPYDPEALRTPSTHDHCGEAKQEDYPGGNYHDFPPLSDEEPKLKGRVRLYPLGSLPRLCRTEMGREDPVLPSYYDERYDPFSSISLVKPSIHDTCPIISPDVDSTGKMRSSVIRKLSRYNPRLNGDHRLYPLGFVPLRCRTNENREKPMVYSNYYRGKYSKESPEEYAIKLKESQKKKKKKKRK